MSSVTRSIRRSSLYRPIPADAGRQSRRRNAPAVRSLIDRVTSLFSKIASRRTTAKERMELDVRNPFIPSMSPTCRAVDQMLPFCVALAGLIGAIIVLFEQVTR